MKKLLLLPLLVLVQLVFGQHQLQYKINLATVENDQVEVEILTPKLTDNTILFKMPRIIPGTYRLSDFGKWVSDVKAYSENGKQLPVEKIDQHSWKIKKAKKLVRITYKVDDITDTDIPNNVYMMSASNFEAGKNFVISPPALFGYLEGHKEATIQLHITKPQGFYGSTGLIPVSSSNTTDQFIVKDYHELVDAPIMYNIPDTTSFFVANTKVLVSVYAPKGLLSSQYISSKIKEILEAQKQYLGGKLPVDKYAFIMYFFDPAQSSPNQGALEHSTSSFYYLPEYPQEYVIQHIADIAAHEFFHIVTPLTIHADEIAHFNYDEPEMSDHLWLYEGVTEYVSDHSQVRYEVISDEMFLQKMEEKLNTSISKYQENLPFTELSRHAATKHQDQYANVYEKGALIAAMLDIELITSTEGQMDLQDLILQLSKHYGKNKPFDDEELFQTIENLSVPESKKFLEKYVAGNSPIPYEYYFSKLGLELEKEPGYEVATLGSIGLNVDPKSGLIMIHDLSHIDAFGEAIGYQKGDILKAINGEEVTVANFKQVLDQFIKNAQAGDTATITLYRKGQKGADNEIHRTAAVMFVQKGGHFKLSIDPNAGYEQRKYRDIWLNATPYTAKMDDVESIDAIITAFYDVISGPKGERNWYRFHSLFYPGTEMIAIHYDKFNQPHTQRLTPLKYEQANTLTFHQTDFYEKETSREVKQFEQIAVAKSSYEYSLGKDLPPEQRGTNMLSLINSQGRWWITHVQWQPDLKKSK